MTLTKSYSVYAGVSDALVQWWYGHNAVAFLLTTPFLGLMYYFVPKAAERPVYSYRLSIVHYWSLIFVYIWAGPHHLLTRRCRSGRRPWAWCSAHADRPVVGRHDQRPADPARRLGQGARGPVLKFLAAGITFYGMSTFEGPARARDVNALGHDTDWTIGHVHNGALGWVALISFGTIYWVVPRMLAASASCKRARRQRALLAGDHRHRALHRRRCGSPA